VTVPTLDVGTYQVTVTVNGLLSNADKTFTISAPAADFTLASSPASRTVTQGFAADYTVTLSPLNGFNSPVTLSVSSGLPTGATAGFSVNPVTPPGNSTLTITTTGATPPGTYSPIVIHSDGGGQMHDTSVELVVLALGITPGTATVPAGGQLTFGSVGGTPPYTFSFVSNQSGGTLNASTGAYTAGPTPGTDTVRVTDAAGTPNTADATVTVVALADQVAVSLDGRALGAGLTMTIASQGGGAALYTGLTTDLVQELELSPGAYTLTAGARSLDFTVTAACTVTLP